MSKRGENIYKRKDGRWEARYIKSYRLDGNPKYGYCYGKSYREARQKAAAEKAAWASGKAVSTESKKRRFSFYCDQWLMLNRSRIKPSTYVKYCTMLENHVKPRLGGCLVQSITSVLIEQFSHELLKEEGLSEKTVKDVLTMLHAILAHTAKQFSEPLPAVEIVYPKVPKKEMRVLTKEEQTRLIQYLQVDSDEYKFGILLALLTGIRLGEVCALKWENLSLQDGTIKVSATMQRLKNFKEDEEEKTKIVISTPKSSHGTRVIPLTDDALRLCKSRRCDNPAAFLLTGDEERYIEPRAMQYRLKGYTRDCGLEGVHFHTLRHTFATRCVEVDFEIKSLSEILGHANPRITLERYVHSSMELKRTNMNKLPTLDSDFPPSKNAVKKGENSHF